jgi:hypothetical protein
MSEDGTYEEIGKVTLLFLGLFRKKWRFLVTQQFYIKHARMISDIWQEQQFLLNFKYHQIKSIYLISFRWPHVTLTEE